MIIEDDGIGSICPNCMQPRNNLICGCTRESEKKDLRQLSKLLETNRKRNTNLLFITPYGTHIVLKDNAVTKEGEEK